MDKKFFSNKKVLVTGHTGFKGTWLTLMLEVLGANVCGYSLPLEKNSFYYNAEIQIDKHVEGDITERKLIDTIQDYQPEIVIHLASHSSLNNSDKIPDYIFRTNVMGVVNLLEGVRSVNSVKTVLIVTSDKCYKNLEKNEPYTEESPFGAQEAYSTSKACQELVTECYRNSFFSQDSLVNIATARASNVISGGDYNITRLIPYLLQQFTNDEIARIRNPQSIRPWQNILDVLFGYLLLTEKLFVIREESPYCTAFNFGPDKDSFRTVNQVVKSISHEFENAKYEFISSEQKKTETKILKLDSSKAKELLNWEARCSFEKTISMTTEFAKRRKSGESVRTICLEYITKYFEEVDL